MSQQWRRTSLTNVIGSLPAPRPLQAPPSRLASAFPLGVDCPVHGGDDCEDRFASGSCGSNRVGSRRQFPSPSVWCSGARCHPPVLASDSNALLDRSTGRTHDVVASSLAPVAARSTLATPPQGRFFPVDSSVAAVSFIPEDASGVSHYQRRDPNEIGHADRSVEGSTSLQVDATTLPTSMPRVRRLRTQRRREQCRVNQARYRQRQNFRLQVLEELAGCRQEEISLMSALRSATLQHLDRVRVATQIVYDYANLFQHGLSGAKLTVPVFRATPPTSAGDMILFSAGSAKDRQSDSLLRQAAYLRTIVASDADFAGALRGPDALLEQWWRYSAFHKHVFFDVLSVEALPSHDDCDNCVRLVATSRLCVVPNSHTLVHVFPHLKHSRLGEKLTEQPLEFVARIGLTFGSTGAGGSLQVVQMSTDVDLVEGFARVLDHLSDVEMVLRGAYVSPEGILGSTVNHPSGNRLLDAMASFDIQGS